MTGNDNKLAEYWLAAEGVCQAREKARSRLTRQGHVSGIIYYVSRIDVAPGIGSRFRVTIYGRQEVWQRD